MNTEDSPSVEGLIEIAAAWNDLPPVLQNHPGVKRLRATAIRLASPPVATVQEGEKVVTEAMALAESWLMYARMNPPSDSRGKVLRDDLENFLRAHLIAADRELRGAGAPSAVGEVSPRGFVKPDNDRQVFLYEQDFYVLSNFSAFNLLWRGIVFPTSEHAYHYEKFYLTKDGSHCICADVLEAPSAHEAFKIAERNKARRRPDWDDVKVDIMRDILRAKVDQHEYVRRKLLATGDRELIEDSWRDNFWGWGPNRDGQNMLGKLWMEVRAALRSSEATRGDFDMRHEPGEAHPQGCCRSHPHENMDEECQRKTEEARAAAALRSDPALAALCGRLRALEQDHEPEGWPAVQMRDISALLDALGAKAEATRVGEHNGGDYDTAHRALVADVSSDEKKSRKTFESAMRARWPGLADNDPDFFSRYPSGEYVSSLTIVGWSMWQAAAGAEGEKR